MNSQVAKKLLEQVVSTHVSHPNTKNIYYSFKSCEAGLLIGDFFEHANALSFPFYGLRFYNATRCSLVYCEAIGSYSDYSQDKNGNWGYREKHTDNVFCKITLVLTASARHYLKYMWFADEGQPQHDSGERLMVFYSLHPTVPQVNERASSEMVDEKDDRETEDEEEVIEERSVKRPKGMLDPPSNILA